MNRVILAALIGAALFVLGYRPAQAAVEFCPVMLSYERVGADTSLIRQQSSKNAIGKSTNVTSSLYGFDLSAYGSRTITSATLAFDTSAGWYTTDVPRVAIAEKDRHYSAPWVTFTRRDYVSPVMYVQFPQAVQINHAWVLNAVANDGDEFGWQSRGQVECDPYATASPGQVLRLLPLHLANPYKLDPKDEENLSASPSSASLIISAKPAKPLKTATCGEPFRVATVKTQAQPQYPRTLMGPAGRISTAVEVAINGDGALADAWIWGPSGFSAFDDEALRAAKASTYTGALAYCEPVPGFYFFRVTFDPNG